jgi:hypothetical protein
MLLTQPGSKPRPVKELPTRPGQRPVEDPPERGPAVPETPDSPPTREPPTRPGATPTEGPPTGPDTIGWRCRQTYMVWTIASGRATMCKPARSWHDVGQRLFQCTSGARH